MENPKFETVQVGDEIPLLSTEPITRQKLALYCGASGDHNPIHVDIDFAKKSGLDDVIAHGMLSAGYLAQMITNWVPQANLRSLNNRFTAMTKVGDSVTCSGEIIEKYEKVNRNFYGGAIGYMDFDGNFNHAIIIRSFISKNNTLSYQAGAGIVIKSNPEDELQEVYNKLGALDKALKNAEDIV